MNKLLSLSINGTPIQEPGSLSHITETSVGPLGENIFKLGIQLLLLTAVVIALFFMITAGIQWVMSGGDKHGVETARQKITYAVIGLVVAFSAFGIIRVVGNFFGMDLI